MTEQSHILFPDDTPKPTAPPDYFKAEQPTNSAIRKCLAHSRTQSV